MGQFAKIGTVAEFEDVEAGKAHGRWRAEPRRLQSSCQPRFWRVQRALNFPSRESFVKFVKRPGPAGRTEGHPSQPCNTAAAHGFKLVNLQASA